LQIRLVDPAAAGERRVGRLTGRFGGPVFEDQQGKSVVVGVISWSTGPNGTGAAAASPA